MTWLVLFDDGKRQIRKSPTNIVVIEDYVKQDWYRATCVTPNGRVIQHEADTADKAWKGTRKGRMA